MFIFTMASPQNTGKTQEKNKKKKIRIKRGKKRKKEKRKKEKRKRERGLLSGKSTRIIHFEGL